MAADNLSKQPTVTATQSSTSAVVPAEVTGNSASTRAAPESSPAAASPMAWSSSLRTRRDVSSSSRAMAAARAPSAASRNTRLTIDSTDRTFSDICAATDSFDQP
jgi:hypothetical protein